MGILGQASVSPWAQFGLPGLVIGALFLALMQFRKDHRSEREAMSKSQQAERTAILGAHREERKEWKDAYEKAETRAMTREDELRRVVTAVEQSIREAGRE